MKQTIVNYIEKLPIVGWALAKSKSTSLPGFGGVALYDVALFFIKQVQTIGMTERASSIAFNLLLGDR